MKGVRESTGLLAGVAARVLTLRGWRRRGLAFLLGLLAALAMPPLSPYGFPLLIVGLTGLGEVVGRPGDGGDALEYRVLRAVIEVVRDGGRPGPLRTGVRRRPKYRDEPIGISERKRL